MIALIRLTADIITFLIIIYIVISYFVPPYNSFRQNIERIVDPMLNPIRQLIPSAGMFDFSPMILLFVIFIAETFLIGILR